MNQQWLIENVLGNLDRIPTSPRDDGREYLSYAHAQRIVDETVEYLGANAQETEYDYIRGHRTRLAHTLTMIPKARGDDESLLDVGCYGYMALWAREHLGYARVVGIEWHPDNDEPVIERQLTIGEASITLRSHNFDISGSKWPIEDEFDCVLLLEVLEHINHDPMGVMEQINARLKAEGTLVMSVPNAISYKAFKEFLVGMPPWTYWFYEPDLSHEPRHCFEYTPIVFKSLITAAGLRENAFRTIYAYSRPEKESETLEIAEALGFHARSFGETMIINATKARSGVPLRYPDVLYSPDGYYKHVHPQLQQRLTDRLKAFRESTRPSQPAAEQIEHKPTTTNHLGDDENLREQVSQLLFTCESQTRKQDELVTILEEAQSRTTLAVRERDQHRDWALDLQSQKQELESRMNQLMFMCDCSLQKETELTQAAQAAETQRDEAVEQARQTRDWAETLSQENADLRAQVNELLFACDCYLQQINDPARCVQVIREQRFRRALDRSKSIARRTPVLRTALRPMYRSTKKFIKRRL
ncbi:MAG: methyltransferase domain-containing protein [Phycisphaerales bacterium]